MITASRLGHAPITIDWSNLSRSPGDSAGSGAEFQSAWEKLKARFDKKEVGFYDAPSNEEISHAKKSVELAQQILAQELFTDCLFLGIGGSSLGPISLLSALREKTSDKIRFHFMENPDPIDWKTTVSKLNPATTLVCCVTKSGTTFETIAQFLIALDWLGKDRWKTHAIGITDPEKGDLRKFARTHGIQTLEIAPSVGGRFSIFTPVGLFPMALAGLNVTDFLKGAQQVREYNDKTLHAKNPLFVVGAELIRQYKTRPIHVSMPYSSPLKQLSSWFVQLWGESLGKDGKGFTPIAALGATDQHSILQLLRDGPDDKITWFVTVDRVDDEVAIPRSISGIETTQLSSFAQLQGHSLHNLMNVEYRAIALVLTRRNRPHLTIQLDRIDERSMGALYFAFSVLTSVTGTLWGVNPFDQPGVEEGKIYIRDSLAERRSEVDALNDPNTPVGRLRRDQT